MASSIFSIIFILYLLVVGFAISFHFILQKSSIPGYSLMNETFYSLFLGIVGAFDSEIFSFDSNGSIAKLFQVLFIIIAFVVFSNLLVGKLNMLYV
jgi:hypothetical protein